MEQSKWVCVNFRKNAKWPPAIHFLKCLSSLGSQLDWSFDQVTTSWAGHRATTGHIWTKSRSLTSMFWDVAGSRTIWRKPGKHGANMQTPQRKAQAEMGNAKPQNCKADARTTNPPCYLQNDLITHEDSMIKWLDWFDCFVLDIAVQTNDIILSCFKYCFHLTQLVEIEKETFTIFSS